MFCVAMCLSVICTIEIQRICYRMLYCNKWNTVESCQVDRIKSSHICRLGGRWDTNRTSSNETVGTFCLFVFVLDMFNNLNLLLRKTKTYVIVSDILRSLVGPYWILWSANLRHVLNVNWCFLEWHRVLPPGSVSYMG